MSGWHDDGSEEQERLMEAARLADKRIARALTGKLCSDCPPAEFPDAPTRCLPCPRRHPTVRAEP